MAHSAVPAPAEREPARELNPSDLHAVADTIPDDAFEWEDEGPSSDHEAHEREEEDLSPEARAAAEDLNLEEHEASEDERRGQPKSAGEEGEPEEPEHREPGEEDPEQKAEAAEEQPGKPDRINLRDDAVIVIDGHEVNGAEVKRGFLRQADYTRKTQEVAVERQQVQALRQQIGAQEAELAQILDLATDITRGVLPKAPDIRQYDTSTHAGLAAFLEHQQVYQQQVRGLEQLVQARQSAAGQQTEQQRAATQAQQEERQSQEQARLQNEIRLMQERIPALRTREGWNNLFSDVEKYGGHYHLAPSDVNGLQDHRHYAVLLDALAYRKLKAAKPAVDKQTQAAPPIRPAARPASGTRAADPQRSAEERFRRDPTLRNAAATLPDSLFE